MKKTLFSLLMIVAAFCLSSCDGKEPIDDSAKKNEAFEGIAETFYSNTLSPTYRSLAEKTGQLAEALEAFQATPSQPALDKVCSIFLSARAQWELSEAFLFGAATDFGIDPHIDSWPLDEDAFKRLLDSPAILAALKGEDADIYAGENLGNALLGFHGIEFVIFEAGAPKSYSKLTEDEVAYAVAVAGDLRNSTWRLEVSWLGDEAPKEHVQACEDLEYTVTVGGSDASYGENLLNASKAGSTFSSWTSAIQYIIQGCITIADEVGSSKIGKPYSGEDITYIESPYSWNSITDFYDNITSVKNSYFGGIEGSRNESKSIHAWLNENAPEIDAAVVNAIDNALEQIGTGKSDTGKGMAYPFVENIKHDSVREAVDACAAVVEALEKALAAVAQ